jgi:DsbC/DsbD-like thiol-disulfide interchange protein
MKSMKILSFFISLAVIAYGAIAYAASDNWQKTSESKLRLVLADQEIQDDTLLYKALLQIEFNDDWYSYWRFAGDAGLPLSLTPAENSGIEAITINWPVPKRHVAYELVSFIYEHSLNVPIDIQLKTDFATNEAYTGRIEAFYMVCNQVCVPQEFSLDVARFDTQDQQDINQNQALLRLAQRSLPHAGKLTALEINTAVLSKDTLVLAVRANSSLEDAQVFIDAGDAALFTAQPEIMPLKTESTATHALIKVKTIDGVEDLNADLSGRTVHVVIENGNKAIQRDFTF